MGKAAHVSVIRERQPGEGKLDLYSIFSEPCGSAGGDGGGSGWSDEHKFTYQTLSVIYIVI